MTSQENKANKSCLSYDGGDVGLCFLFWNFLKIGTLGFGGFMALISMIENVVVNKQKLITHHDMLEGISLANMLPGATAVNVVAYVGYRCRGGLGTLVSVTAVLLPTFVLIVVFTHLYFAFSTTVDMEQLFIGITPAITAVIFSVAWRMTKSNLKGLPEFIIALISAVIIISFKGQFVILSLIFLSGVVGWLWFKNTIDMPEPSDEKIRFPMLRIVLTLSMVVVLVVLSVIPLDRLPLPIEDSSISHFILTFSSLSVVLFGGGYIFIPMLNDVVVNSHGWLTQREFIDGIAMGQITPGPIVISAAFISQKVVTETSGFFMGFLAALTTSIAIFTPPVIVMVTAANTLNWLKQSRVTHAAMHGIRCTVLGMIFAAAMVFGISALPGAPAGILLVDYALSADFWRQSAPILIIFLGSMLALIKFKVEVVLVIVISGVFGWFFG